jgi:hypothetical protein
MARVNLHNSNALMAAYHQSKTIPPRRKPPIPVPGYGGYVQQRDSQRFDDSLNPRQRFGPRPQRAPYAGSRKDRPMFDRRNTIRPRRRIQVN